LDLVIQLTTGLIITIIILVTHIITALIGIGGIIGVITTIATAIGTVDKTCELVISVGLGQSGRTLCRLRKACLSVAQTVVPIWTSGKHPISESLSS
jgi:hypothetical protein